MVCEFEQENLEYCTNSNLCAQVASSHEPWTRLAVASSESSHGQRHVTYTSPTESASGRDVNSVKLKKLESFTAWYLQIEQLKH